MTADESGFAPLPEVAVVVVSFRVPELLRRCLASLAAVGDGLEIVVVDNASGDASPDIVRREFPGVRLIENDVNVGFAAATNAGIVGTRSRYVLLLNPDACIDGASIRQLVAFLDARPEAAVAGPRLVGDDGRTQPSFGSYPSLPLTLFTLSGLNRLLSPARQKYYETPVARHPPEAVPVPAVFGACMLVRREAIDEVGLLDDAYFMYHEDMDWCKRFRDHGWFVWYVPEVQVVHGGGRSTSLVGNGSDELWHVEWPHNDVRFFRKHYGRATAVAAVGVHVAFGALGWTKHVLRDLLRARRSEGSETLVHRRRLAAALKTVRHVLRD